LGLGEDGDIPFDDDPDDADRTMMSYDANATPRRPTPGTPRRSDFVQSNEDEVDEDEEVEEVQAQDSRASAKGKGRAVEEVPDDDQGLEEDIERGIEEVNGVEMYEDEQDEPPPPPPKKQKAKPARKKPVSVTVPGNRFISFRACLFLML
jgi:hypothetical protein